VKGERRDKRKHKFSGFIASLPYFNTNMPALAPVAVRPQPIEKTPALLKPRQQSATFAPVSYTVGTGIVLT